MLTPLVATLSILNTLILVCILAGAIYWFILAIASIRKIAQLTRPAAYARPCLPCDDGEGSYPLGHDVRDRRPDARLDRGV